MCLCYLHTFKKPTVTVKPFYLSLWSQFNFHYELPTGNNGLNSGKLWVLQLKHSQHQNMLKDIV